MRDEAELLIEPTVRLISHVQLEDIVGSKMAARMLEQHLSHGHSTVSPRRPHHYSSEHSKHSHQQSDGHSNNSHPQSNGHSHHPQPQSNGHTNHLLSHSDAQEPERLPRHRMTHRQSNGHNNNSHHHSNGHHSSKDTPLKLQARSKSEVRETPLKTGSHSAAPKLEHSPRHSSPRPSGGIPRLPHREINHSHQQNNRHTDSSAHRHGHGSHNHSSRHDNGHENHSHRQSNGHDNHFRGDGHRHTNYSPRHGNGDSNHSYRQRNGDSNHSSALKTPLESGSQFAAVDKKPEQSHKHSSAHRQNNGHTDHSSTRKILQTEVRSDAKASEQPSRHSSAQRQSNGHKNHSHRQSDHHSNHHHQQSNGHGDHSAAQKTSLKPVKKPEEPSKHLSAHQESNGQSNHPHQQSDGQKGHLSEKPSAHSSTHRPSNGNANLPTKETALKPEKAIPESATLCLKCRDFTVPDQHAARFPRESNSDLRKLAIDLTSPFPDVIDKTRALFTWMHHNITYDDDNYAQRSIEETLRSGLAVCGGYANLFSMMASYVDIESVDVSGYGHGDEYSRAKNRVSAFKSNHAWNAVKFPQGWHLIDCTWGAGGTTNGAKWQKRFKPYHFTQTPEEFRRRHFPENPKHQYCRDIMAWEEFIRIDEPDIYGIFTYSIVDFSPYTLEPAHRLLTPNTPYRFRLTRACEHQEETKFTVVLIGVAGYEWRVLESDSHGGKVSTGTTGPTGSTVSLELVTKYEQTPNGGYSMERSVICEWTVA